MLPHMLQLEFLLRILLSCICGTLVGLERSKRLKEAGVRTHCMVACGAALLMIVSKYGFTDLSGEAGLLYGTRGADPARIAAQVVTGVGFLGAGVIFRTGVSIKGLTTAAGLWTTAGVGMALGAGMYFVGIAGTVLIVGVQFIMHHFSFGNDAYTMQEITMRFYDSRQLRDLLFQMVEVRGGILYGCSANRSSDGDITYVLTVRVRTPITVQELQAFMDEHEEVRSFSI